MNRRGLSLFSGARLILQVRFHHGLMRIIKDLWYNIISLVTLDMLDEESKWMIISLEKPKDIFS